MFICFKITEISFNWWEIQAQSLFFMLPSSPMLHKDLKADTVWSFTTGVVLCCSGDTLELRCWVSRLLVTLPCSSLEDGLATSPRALLHAEALWSLPLRSLEEIHCLFGAPQDTVFSFFPLENSPNFFNDFSFYKCPEESLASSNFNSLCCVSYWGKEIPRAWRCVWNEKGKIKDKHKLIFQ